MTKGNTFQQTSFSPMTFKRMVVFVQQIQSSDNLAYLFYSLLAVTFEKLVNNIEIFRLTDLKVMLPSGEVIIACTIFPLA